MSPIEMERKGNQYWNLNSTLAFIGGKDWESGYFQVEKFSRNRWRIGFLCSTDLC